MKSYSTEDIFALYIPKCNGKRELLIGYITDAHKYASKVYLSGYPALCCERILWL